MAAKSVQLSVRSERTASEGRAGKEDGRLREKRKLKKRKDQRSKTQSPSMTTTATSSSPGSRSRTVAAASASARSPPKNLFAARPTESPPTGSAPTARQFQSVAPKRPVARSPIRKKKRSVIPAILTAPTSQPAAEPPVSKRSPLHDAPWSLMPMAPISDKDFGELGDRKSSARKNVSGYEKFRPKPEVKNEAEYEKTNFTKIGFKAPTVLARSASKFTALEDKSASVAEIEPTGRVRRKYREKEKREKVRERRLRINFRRLLVITIVVLAAAFLIGFFLGMGIYVAALPEDEDRTGEVDADADE